MIQITQKYFLKADAYNLILCEARVTGDSVRTKAENIGKVRYEEIGFYKTLSEVVDAIFKTEFRRGVADEELTSFADAVSGVMKCMAEVRDSLDRVEAILKGGGGG